jgi:hypothetical protein
MGFHGVSRKGAAALVMSPLGGLYKNPALMTKLGQSVLFEAIWPQNIKTVRRPSGETAPIGYFGTLT